MPRDLNHPWWFYIRFVDLSESVSSQDEWPNHWYIMASLKKKQKTKTFWDEGTIGEAATAVKKPYRLLIAPQSVTAPCGIRLVRTTKVRTSKGSLGADGEDVFIVFTTGGLMLWLMSVHHVLNKFTLVFFMKRRDKRGTGRIFLEHGKRGRAPFFHSRVRSCELKYGLPQSRLVSELYLTLWTGLHIAMTCVIVFKRGCIFMCNSFVEIMFAIDGASDWLHHFITLGKFTRLLFDFELKYSTVLRALA